MHGKSGRLWVGLAVAGGLLTLAIAGSRGLPPARAQQRAAAGGGESPAAHASALSQAFRSASQQVLPAVVSIKNEAQPKLAGRGGGSRPGPRGGRQLPPELDHLDPLLKKFFEGSPGLELPEEFSVPSLPRASSGSGVIIDPAGVILTNNHVVAGEGKVTVKLHDGRQFTASEVKTDPSTDLAIVKIEAGGALPFAKLGDSDALQVGDWVLALGAPFGLENTVTAGIISAKSRSIGITRHEEFLQTDAAINPGNSGGPLISLQGEVVGVNTAINSRSGGFEGIGFAVPANVAQWVSGQLRTDGVVQRAYLGVGVQSVDADLAEQLGVPAGGGALVTDVQPNSPAAAAGLRSQDVILSFGGAPVSNHRQLSAVVARTPLGTQVPVKIIRDGKEQTLSVTVREAPANYGLQTEQPASPRTPKNSEFNSLGLVVGPLSRDAAAELGLNSAAGVVIVAVERGGLAERAGLEPGMAITQVGRQAVASPAEFEAALAKVSLDKGVLLLVRSAEGSRFVVLRSS